MSAGMLVIKAGSYVYHLSALIMIVRGKVTLVFSFKLEVVSYKANTAAGFYANTEKQENKLN